MNNRTEGITLTVPDSDRAHLYALFDKLQKTTN